jgi:FkbM family methyltransferase
MNAEIRFKYAGKSVTMFGYSDQDWIVQAMRLNNSFYELDLLKYVRFLLRRRRGIILDIGANIGNHSVFLGMFTKNSIACFEPNPEILPILEKNLNVNQVEHKLFKFGLGSSENHYEVVLPDEMPNNIAAARLISRNDGQILVRRLDDVIPDIEHSFGGMPVIAIKADIEGMEAEMLRGALTTIEKYKPELFLEIFNQRSMLEIEAILKPIGYVKIVSWAVTPVWHFVHKDKFSFLQRAKIYLYIGMHRCRSEIFRYLRGAIKIIKSVLSKIFIRDFP